MARITVGVPVYNGAATLRACLACLRDQTFRDIEVLISDNCSQDESAAIAEEFVQADGRFRLIRQSENVGARRNFCIPLEAATSELFMWRADDYFSDLHFIEKLTALFDVDPSLELAVPHVTGLHHDGSLWREQPFVKSDAENRAHRIGANMLSISPSAIYGLWSRHALLRNMDRATRLYEALSGWDHIVIFPSLLDEKIAGDESTTLTFRTNPPREVEALTAYEILAIRRRFRRVSLMALRERKWGVWDRLWLEYYVRLYAARNIYRFWKTVRHFIRSKLGIQRRRKK